MGKELRQKSLLGKIYSAVTANKMLSAVVPVAITQAIKVRLARANVTHSNLLAVLLSSVLYCTVRVYSSSQGCM